MRPSMLLRALLTALLAVAPPFLAGCARDEQPPAPVIRESPQGQPVSVPARGWLQHDPQEIARDRQDVSWRQWAQQDYERRRQLLAGTAPGATPAMPSPAASPAPSPSASPAGAAPAVTPTPTPAATPSAATGVATTGGAGLPIDRLRQAAAPATAANPAATAPSNGPAGAAAARESWDALSRDAFGSPPVLPLADDAAGPTALRTQRLLDRVRFSPGIVDGHWGKNSIAAVFWLQAALGLQPTGKLDRGLYDRLVAAVGNDAPLRTYTVTPGDLQGPFVTIPQQPAEQAKLACLCYTSPAEELAERFHTTPELLAKLNPGVDLARPAAGTTIAVPDVDPLPPPHETRRPLGRIAWIVISKGGRYLQALDARGNILLHFPATVGAGYDPSPDGSFHVTRVTFEPDFHYDPKLFAEVPDTEPDEHLPKGPNSPVGLVWMALSKEHYGIHGTSEPETIGYASSHGCVRMTNWDALYLAGLIPEGTPVEFRP